MQAVVQKLYEQQLKNTTVLQSIQKTVDAQLKLDNQRAKIEKEREQREKDDANRKNADSGLAAAVQKLVDKDKEKEEKNKKGEGSNLLSTIGDVSSIATLTGMLGKSGALMKGLLGLSTALAPFAVPAGAGILGLMALQKLGEAWTGGNRVDNQGNANPGMANNIDFGRGAQFGVNIGADKEAGAFQRDRGGIKNEYTRNDYKSTGTSVDLGNLSPQKRDKRRAFYREILMEMKGEEEKAVKNGAYDETEKEVGHGRRKRTVKTKVLNEEKEAAIREKFAQRRATLEMRYEQEGLSRKDERIPQELKKGGGVFTVPGIPGSGDKPNPKTGNPYMLRPGSFVLNYKASRALNQMKDGGTVPTLLEGGETVFDRGSLTNLNKSVPRSGALPPPVPTRVDGKIQPTRKGNGAESENSVMPFKRGGKVFLHWAASGYSSASPSYHATVQGDGTVRKTRDYNQFRGGHTSERNSEGIGISLAAMSGASDKHFGSFPVKPEQYETMAKLTAGILKEWGHDASYVTEKNVQTHAEAGRQGDSMGNYGPTMWGGNGERWDLMHLYQGDKPGSGGPKIRSMIKGYMGGNQEISITETEGTSGASSPSELLNSNGKKETTFRSPSDKSKPQNLLQMVTQGFQNLLPFLGTIGLTAATLEAVKKTYFNNRGISTNNIPSDISSSDSSTNSTSSDSITGDTSKSNKPYDITSSIGFSKADWDIYRNSVGAIESGNRYDPKGNGMGGGSGGMYDGRWQLGGAAKEDAARYLYEAVPVHGPSGSASRKAYIADHAMQERYFAAFTAKNHSHLMSHPKYKAMSTREKFEVLGYAHNQGAGGAAKWLDTGEVGQDGFGTKADKYAKALRSAYQSQPIQQARGGMSSALQPAVLEGGEMVFSPEMVTPQLERLNEMVPRFQTGGVVGSRNLRAGKMTNPIASKFDSIATDASMMDNNKSGTTIINNNIVNGSGGKSSTSVDTGSEIPNLPNQPTSHIASTLMMQQYSLSRRIG